jgi:hypothetical protein
VDIDAVDEWGCGALHLACRALHPAVVARLLAGGADVNEANAHGLDVAGELARKARTAVEADGVCRSPEVEAIGALLDGHAACRHLQRLQVLQWATGTLHYRTGRHSTMALQLPSALAEHIAGLVSTATVSNRTAAAPATLARFEAQDAADFEVKIESARVSRSTLSTADGQLRRGPFVILPSPV